MELTADLDDITVPHVWRGRQGALSERVCSCLHAERSSELPVKQQFIKANQQAMFTSAIPDIDVNVRRQIVKILQRTEPDEEATKELIMKHVRAAPPLSTWDVPAAGRKGYGMYGAKRSTAVGRASDYWKSDVDDYALPDPGSAPGDRSSGFSYFSSAKSMNVWPQAPAPPKPPVQRLESSNRNLPPPLPFTFAGRDDSSRPEATLTSFTSGANSSLAAMKALGLPGDVPSAAGAGSSAGATGASSIGIPLARGTKRLGMGRPAPWGATKRAKQ